MIETPRTTRISDELLDAIAADLVQRIVEGRYFLPLLPRQRAVRDRLDQEEIEAEVEAAERDLLRDRPDTRCRGGTFTEPLHHHAHGHDRRRSFFRRQGGKS